MRVTEFASKLGLNAFLEFRSEILTPEERIRDFCLENKCGNYSTNYMCPPYVGSVEEIRIRLKKYERGILLQYTKLLDVKGDRDGVIQTKLDFHNKVLQMEGCLRETGINRIWGMIGGNCELCHICGAKIGQPCSYQDKARTSLESLAIDVLSLMDKLGMDNKFHADRITWTGCILMP